MFWSYKMKYCPQCGTPLEPNNKFCGNCGRRLSDYGNVVSVQTMPAKLSKSFYVGSIAGGGVLGLIMIEIGVWLDWLFILYTTIVGLVLLYKVWAAIQDGHASTTPGKAVGFLFIPFFQLYWVFRAYWGYAKDYNFYIDRHNISTSRLPEGLFLAYCIMPYIYVIAIILLTITMTPWFFITTTPISFVLTIPMFVIGIIIAVKLCDAVNSLSAEDLSKDKDFGIT